MMTAETLRTTFEKGRDYAAYVATGTAAQQASWGRIHEQVRLTAEQRSLAASFTRAMPVLVVSGVWCGDCAQQCPILQRIAEAGPAVDLRFVDRDEQHRFAEQLRICGGSRVPVAVFMAEDFEFAGLAGDRTLARYRALAARQLGASCPLPGAPVAQDQIEAETADWMREFERVHLMLRLSPRLRQKHGD
ncbi:MAG: thioredoxin family protein [Planctomycetota bacterium]|nr:thioredoxin family protein [Planctomycetota bacterium]